MKPTKLDLSTIDLTELLKNIPDNRNEHHQNHVKGKIDELYGLIARLDDITEELASYIRNNRQELVDYHTHLDASTKSLEVVARTVGALSPLSPDENLKRTVDDAMGVIYLDSTTLAPKEMAGILTGLATRLMVVHEALAAIRTKGGAQ